MFRSTIAALFLGTSLATVANAQSGGPPIAYVKFEGAGSATIYLTNDNGKGTVKLYAAPSKTKVLHLDLKPGGGEIAFVERRDGSHPVLKVLAFSSSGSALGQPRTLDTPCRPYSVDYHPDPARALLIFAGMCSDHMNITTIDTEGRDHQVLLENRSDYIEGVRWLKDGVSYVYIRDVDARTEVQQLCRNACDTGSDVLWSGHKVGRLDVGRVSNKILFDRGTQYISELDADTRTVVRENFINGTDGHYSPDDTRVLYETSGRNTYLDIDSGPSARVAGKGDYGVKDWRK
ncbi:MAG TPA: hypothetical protein VM346_06725 [Sphingomicrobium sp.]|jgi:Tol biopolymer transport system component|nr:hypothetical protein [Sphingomicrobium sp.]